MMFSWNPRIAHWYPLPLGGGILVDLWSTISSFYDKNPYTRQYKYRLKRKEKNKSREEIFYQMKGFFFLRSVVGSVFCKSTRCP